jgi:hypothetical protein
MNSGESHSAAQPRQALRRQDYIEGQQEQVHMKTG